jgi:organic hydroperoxide reductase OsmC/OhrA
VSDQHEFASRLVWDGAPRPDQKWSYASYGRQHHIEIFGKPDLQGSADPAFRGEGGKHNPEDLFLAALSGCHLLSYLALCARKGIRIIAYEDEARGVLKLDSSGGGKFESVTLHPHVTIDDEKNRALALQLHEEAHHQCFIANSSSVPINHEPVIDVA